MSLHKLVSWIVNKERTDEQCRESIKCVWV